MSAEESQLIQAIEVVVERSDGMVEWALAIGAGSVAVILSTSYRRPATLGPRLIYLLFVPAWIALGCSVYFGDQIARRLLAAQFATGDRLLEIRDAINADFIDQLSALGTSLVFLALWLIAYLLYWTFGDWKVENSEAQTEPRGGRSG